MTAERLSTIRVKKPWGRSQLWPGFIDPAPTDPPIGEIWFDAPPGTDPELLIKYLFTSDRLSIQVHPNDTQAHAAGLKRGKEEAWIILAADAGATIGLGMLRPLSADDLRAAALDGSIEQLLDWKPVAAGDVIYSPAGTVHAIGAGVTLIEVQQNLDLTYRLYDYGSARELHLEEGVAVSKAVPFTGTPGTLPLGPDRMALVSGQKFVVEQWRWSGGRTAHLPPDRPAWLIPVSGSGTCDGQKWRAGECWMMTGDVDITLQTGADVLFAYAGPTPLETLF
jgi:mannose-6-phosphate isomerase